MRVCARVCVRTLHFLFASFFLFSVNSHEDDINAGIGSTRGKRKKTYMDSLCRIK